MALCDDDAIFSLELRLFVLDAFMHQRAFERLIEALPSASGIFSFCDER